LWEVSRVGKFIETELGDGGNGSLCLMGTEVQSGKIKAFWTCSIENQQYFDKTWKNERKGSGDGAGSVCPTM